MSRVARDKRLTLLERQASRAPDPGTAEVDRWCAKALGCTFDEIETDDLMRIEMLLRDAPEFAHPLLLRACIGRAEDREPPDGEARRVWQRRRWGYTPARDDPEAWAVGQQLEAWASAPDRPYRNGADLRRALHHIGVLPWDGTGYFELRRLVDLCAALDKLATEHPSLEVPAAVWWAVLGWHEHHPRRHHGAVGLERLG